MLGGHMVVGTKQKRQHSYKGMASGLALFLMLCLFLLSGCGSANEPDHPLTMGTAAGDQGSPTADTGNQGTSIPIYVVNGQSALSSYPGGFMTITVSTSPFAVCNFIVYYGLSTPSKTFGIIPRTADANGIASWHWQVDGNARTGVWPVNITATLPSGEHATSKVNVFVTLPPINVVTSQTNLSGPPNSDLMLTIATAPSVDCTLLLNFGPGIQSKT